MEEQKMIRPMTPADLPAVLAVERASFSNPWSFSQFERELENPISNVDLLLVSGELAGYLVTWFVAGELHVLNVTTAPLFRRRGLARRLLENALERGRSRGMEKAFLEVRAGNDAAIALYGRLGFRPVGRRAGYYPDGEDALTMEWPGGTARPAGLE